jgi:hypothetical protein
MTSPEHPMVPEGTVKRPSSDKTLRERIAEWRTLASYAASGMRPLGEAELGHAADELTPIAEALEAVVRELRSTKGHVAAVVLANDTADRLERIVGQP